MFVMMVHVEAIQVNNFEGQSRRSQFKNSFVTVTEPVYKSSVWCCALLIYGPELLITFRVRHSRGEMCIDHAICVSVPHHIPTLEFPQNFGEW